MYNIYARLMHSPLQKMIATAMVENDFTVNNRL